MSISAIQGFEIPWNSVKSIENILNMFQISLEKTNRDDGFQVDAVFLDFTKAFDRVHPKILLNKLCNFGILGSLLEWYSDYLSNRAQRVVMMAIVHVG